MRKYLLIGQLLISLMQLAYAENIEPSFSSFLSMHKWNEFGHELNSGKKSFTPFLNSNDTLNPNTGYSGSLDLQGYPVNLNPDSGQCVSPVDTFVTVITYATPPCPSAGDDIFLQFCSQEFLNLFLWAFIPNSTPWGQWSPPLDPGFPWYNGGFDPCFDEEGTYYYFVSEPGCPNDTAVVTIDITTWDPCGWYELIYGECVGIGDPNNSFDDTILITVPPIPGYHDGTSYSLSVFPGIVVSGIGNYDLTSTFLIVLDSIWPFCPEINIVDDDTQCQAFFYILDYCIPVEPCDNPPCPIGHDAEITCALYYVESQFLDLLDAGTGGTWDPPVFTPDNLYNPCLDGEGTFAYTWNPPGCPPETDVLTIDWQWDPCDWALEDVCFNGDTISFTIPPFPGNQTPFTYSVYQCIDDFVGDNYSSETANTFTFYYPPCVYNNSVLWIDVYWECSWGFSIPLTDIPACFDPACPSAGEDITISGCPTDLTPENILLYLNADPGGTWDPISLVGVGGYGACIDTAESFTYTQDNPGCPVEQATITFDWTWDPCGWELEGLCLTGDEGSFTIPAFQGDHPGSTYTVYSTCITVMPTTGSLDESTDFTFSWDSCWLSSPGCISIFITINEDISCSYYFGEQEPVNGDWVLCDLPLCNCANPPNAGNDNMTSFCEDAPPFNLTTLLGGNFDPGGSWTPPLNSGGNIYSPALDGSGTFIYTVTASDCPDDQANVTVTVQPNDPVLISGIPATLCETSAPISLSTIQNGITGNWSGTGVLNNQFNPSGLNGMITITFTPNPNQCATPATTIIDVHPFIIITVVGIPDTVCQNVTPTALTTIQSGINGNWSGTGVINNIFNPNGLSGNIVLTFSPNANECADPAAVTIHVSLATTPVIIGVPDTMCQVDLPVNLPPILDGITGNWTGNGVSNNTFNPTGLSGSIAITFNANVNQCANNVSSNIQVNALVIPLITGVPASLCSASLPVTLPSLQNGISGNWTGTGVINNEFNPTGLNGNITLTFTPDLGQCSVLTTYPINVSSEITIVLTGIPDSLCENNTPINLSTLQSGVMGQWSGPGINNNILNPIGLNGNIQLVFTPDTGQCANPIQDELFIENAIVPILTGIPDSLCQSDLPASLSTLQNGFLGNWTGSGIMNNVFNPSGLTGNIPITFLPNSNYCAFPANGNIYVSNLIIPQITGVPDSICQNAAAVTLTTSPISITGTWNGAGVMNNIFSPVGLNGNVTLTFSPDQDQCAASVATSITVNTIPSFQNLIAICDSIANSYSVSFDISGGLPGSYTVNGMPLAGSHFSSSPIDDDSIFYQFFLDDQSGCGPVSINGVKNCACATYSGSMNFNSAPLLICVSSQINVLHNGDQILDSDDLLGFVIHDNAGTQLGFVYALSSTTIFSVPPGIVLGQTYFISSIAGSNDGSGNIDLSDDCLSVSQGIPVVFYQPGATISQGGSICPLDCFTYHVLLTGEKPFVLEYNVLANGMTFPKMMPIDTSWVDLLICPSDYGIISGNMDLVLISLTDVNCNISLSPTSGTAIIVHPDVITLFNRLLCDGESVIINTILYDQSHPSGTEIFPNGSVFGCDSLVNINLSFYPPVVFDLNQTLCFGNNLPVNGTIYDELNPVGTETIINGSVHGCDSIINIHLEFDSIVTTELSLTLCSGEAVVIHGTTYDENHPAGSELYVNGSVMGCDSLVNIDLSFNPPSSFELKDTLCKDEGLIVNGIVYDYLNPTGTEILSHGSTSGCDSIIAVTLSFYPEVIVTIDDTLDKGETLVINGTTYDQMNPTGTELIPNGNLHGCDSVIVVNLHFKSNVLTVDFEVEQPHCYGDYATIQLNSILGGIHSYWVHVDQFPDVPVDHFPYIIGDFYEGFHFLVIQDAEGLAEKYEVIFEVHEVPPLLVDAGPDQSLMQNQDAMLQAQASFSNVTWNWWPPDFLTCTDCPDPVVLQPIHNILYTVQVTDINGCTATDVISIKVATEYDIYFPNIFSPNGDGVNDVVFLNSHANIRIIKSLQIFDRWGGVLFQQKNFLPNDPKYGWDGTSDGKDLNPGVYVWMAEVEFEDGNTKMFSAEVTLIR